MANEALYAAMLGRAGVHLERAYDRFHEDPEIPWSKMTGNVPRERARVWVDALKQALAHYEQIERQFS